MTVYEFAMGLELGEWRTVPSNVTNAELAEVARERFGYKLEFKETAMLPDSGMIKFRNVKRVCPCCHR